MRTRLPLIAITTVLLAAGCAASGSIPPLRTDVGDVPVLEGLSYRADDSIVIESRNVRAARLLYRGRLEPGSLAVELQRSLETGGWRFVRATSGSPHGTVQLYEKGPASLQIQIWEGGLFDYYTYVEVSTTRPIAAPATSAAR